MIASGIFFCLFVLLMLTLRRHAWSTVLVYFLSLVSIVLLFLHHATDQLDISL
ncbi:MAG: DUF5993 family protein [Planctomycetota bacterium]|nr:DUF5993 family protein [Planctomycetota bacterium]